MALVAMDRLRSMSLSQLGYLAFAVVVLGAGLAAWNYGLFGDSTHDAQMNSLVSSDPTAADRDALRERIDNIGDYSDVPDYE